MTYWCIKDANESDWRYMWWDGSRFTLKPARAVYSSLAEAKRAAVSTALPLTDVRIIRVTTRPRRTVPATGVTRKNGL